MPASAAAAAGSSKSNLQLHHSLVRLAKDVLEVLALDESSSASSSKDVLEKIELPPKHAVLRPDDSSNHGPLGAVFQRNDTNTTTTTTKEQPPPVAAAMATKQEVPLAIAAPDDESTSTGAASVGGPLELFRRISGITKLPSSSSSSPLSRVAKDDEDNGDGDDADAESVWDHMWELVLGDEMDELLDDEEEDDAPSSEGSESEDSSEEEEEKGDDEEPPATESKKSILTPHRRFRFRFWQSGADNEDEDDNGDEDDDDEDGAKLDNWNDGRFDVGSDSDDSDDESVSSSMEETDASSSSSSSSSSRQEEEEARQNTKKEMEEIKGQVFVPHRLLEEATATGTKKKTDREPEEDMQNSADPPPSNDDRNEMKRTSLRTRVLILVKPKKDAKEVPVVAQEAHQRLPPVVPAPTFHEEVESETTPPPAKHNMARRASRLFTVKRPPKNHNETMMKKQHEAADDVIASEGAVPLEEQQQEIEQPEKAAGPASSPLFAKAATTKDTKSHEQETGIVVTSEVVPSEGQQSAQPERRESEQPEDSVVVSSSENNLLLPTWVQFERFPSSFLILAKPTKDAAATEHEEQEVGLVIDTEDVPFDEQVEELNWASDPDPVVSPPIGSAVVLPSGKQAEPTWTSRLLGHASKHDEGASPNGSASAHEQAESTWESFFSQLTTPTNKPQEEADEEDVSPIDSDDVPSNINESESAEFKRSGSSFRHLSMFKPSKRDTKKYHEEEESPIDPGHAPHEESGQLQCKRAFALPRMVLPFKRQERSPHPTLEDETPVQAAQHDIIKDIPDFLCTFSDDGGTESGSSTGTDFGNWMSGSLGETDNNIEWDINGKVGEKEVPDSITLQNKSSFTPSLVSMKNKMWPTSTTNVVAGGGVVEDCVDGDDEKIESNEKDHKMALLRKRWASISKRMHDTRKNKKLSIGVDVLDASGKVIRKIWLHSRRKGRTIEVVDSSDASDSDASSYSDASGSDASDSDSDVSLRRGRSIMAEI